MVVDYRDRQVCCCWWCRFIKSYKKFGDPCSRLQDIAADASLHCKQSQLKKLAQTLHTSCVEAEQKSLKITQSTANGSNWFYTFLVISLSLHVGKKQPAITLKLGGVTVNCQSILRREEELAPLARCIPKDPATRKRLNPYCVLILGNISAIDIVWW